MPALPQTHGGLKVRQLRCSALQSHFGFHGFASTSKQQSQETFLLGWGGGPPNCTISCLLPEAKFVNPHAQMPDASGFWGWYVSESVDWIFFSLNLTGRGGGGRGKAWEWAKDFRSGAE